MNLSSIAPIWTYLIGPVMGAIIGILGTYLLQKIKERGDSKNKIPNVSCSELINTKLFDKNSLGVFANTLQIKIGNEDTKDKNLRDISEIYFSRYKLQNLSNQPVSDLLIKVVGGPKSVWYSVSQSKDNNIPDWENKFKSLWDEIRASEIGKKNIIFKIPYLNPYTTNHEIYIDLYSYLPLEGIKVCGGAKGINFKNEK